MRSKRAFQQCGKCTSLAVSLPDCRAVKSVAEDKCSRARMTSVCCCVAMQRLSRDFSCSVSAQQDRCRAAFATFSDDARLLPLSAVFPGCRVCSSGWVHENLRALVMRCMPPLTGGRLRLGRRYATKGGVAMWFGTKHMAQRNGLPRQTRLTVLYRVVGV